MNREADPGTPRYRGRFAPSPTGPLHFGSLVAAIGSYLDARSRQGDWLIRMEDLDPPREVEGAADLILFTLDSLALGSDQPVMFQSTRADAYQETLERLERDGLIYHCGCTRKEILAAAVRTVYGPIYPGTCRDGLPPGRKPRSVRVRTRDEPVGFEDRLQGPFHQNLADQVGDFIVRRSDGLTAYQLAVVVDDADQGITDIVRGSDLLDSTPRQLQLQRYLQLPEPRYLHLPMAVDAAGDKLSKQTFAPAVDPHQGAVLIESVLRFLRQPLPGDFSDGTLDDCWRWAIDHWDPALLPGKQALPAPPDTTGPGSGRQAPTNR